MPTEASPREGDSSVSLQQNRDGKWVPAIPLPIYRLWLKECPTCGEAFYTQEGYRGHYALRHVLNA